MVTNQNPTPRSFHGERNPRPGASAMPDMTINDKDARSIGVAYDAVVTIEASSLTNIVAKYRVLGDRIVPTLPARDSDGKRPRGYFAAFQKAMKDKGVDMADARVSRAI